MKRNLLLMLAAFIIAAAYSQTPNPIQGDGRFTNINAPNVKHNLNTRATGSYYLDYREYDANYLGTTMNNGVYGNLTFTKTDTSYGGVPMVAEYYDSLVYSADLTNWTALAWNNVASMTVDSVFITLNVDNSSGANDSLRMKIVTPTTTTNAQGNYLNFNTTPLWEDTAITNIDIGTITGSNIGFGTVSFAPGINVTNSFALIFEFYGSVQDTCRLLWSYPTSGASCTNNAIAQTPLKWELYPTSFYNICLGGTGLTQTPSISLPRISGSGTFAYYADCDNPSSPYINDSQASGFDPAKNPFQHWNIWAIVTLTDNLGIAEQAEKGIKVYAYPNPATNLLNIDFTLLHNAHNVSIKLTDLSGRVVLNKTLGSFAIGKNKANVEIDVPSGVYTYSLDVDGINITRKFIVNK